ncbi:hypothetical protein C2S52_015359 [Perilla frutescens var. hirtella]|nr:hypothetical protein C2S52_015359 [Perilla frutescens var. hirtella]
MQNLCLGPLVGEENVVGFEDERSALIRYLSEETEKLDVISIVGMPGIGKTTLARMVYKDPDIEYNFPIRIWIHVSNKLTEKDVFVNILRQVNGMSEDLIGKSDEELAQLVVWHLRNGRFLIVMDDVRSADDWDKIRVGLPVGNKMSKVLITTCDVELGRHANRSRLPHKLQVLDESQSWKLLQLEVFGKHECPPQLENIGKLIAKQCEGLPLAIVVIGAILIQEDSSSSSDMRARRTAWIKASQSFPKFRDKKFYDNLPSHLQVCFLYLAMFPYDFEIPAWGLIHMWIAEGFIIREYDDATLEETAEIYLEDLINRNLVQVIEIKSNGKVKTCRIHRMLHHFCKIEAGIERENVLQEIKFTDGGVSELPINDLLKCRRLCIHSNILGFLSSKPFAPHVRSFASFSKDDINLPLELISVLPCFKLLRVLDVMPIKFYKIPSDMFHLVHLRYLALSSDLSILASAFCKLWNMQTLVVKTTSRTLEIKFDIWKLIQLRHLKTNAMATLPMPGETGKEGEKLQSLSTISPESCTEELFHRARNLKKLGIRGELSLFFDGKIGSFDSLFRLSCLQNLMLLNDVFPRLPSEGRLRSLPPAYKFPPRLRKLTLADTFLDWSQMTTLGLLEKLEVLNLKDNAFVGRIWETHDRGFESLEALQIGKTDLVIWVASATHFPRLRCLKLHHCEELQEVPIELADIPRLQLLDLYYTKLAAASARKLEGKRQNYLKQPCMEAQEFKLSIYPL